MSGSGVRDPDSALAPPEPAPALRAMLFGEGGFERHGAPEPSLLPHLARWVAHDDLDEVALTVARLALAPHSGLPWYPLAEATADVVIGRGGEWAPQPDETEVRRVRLADDPVAGRRLSGALPPPDDPTGARLRALLAPVLGAADVRALVETVDWSSLPAEPARSLLEGAVAHGVDVPPGAILAAITAGPADELPLARAAHLLPFLDGDTRRAAVEIVVGELSPWEPPWYLALVVSRVAPFVDAALVPATDVEPPWRGLLLELRRAGWPDQRHGDVLRAHPLAGALAQVHGRHESSFEALLAARDRWSPMAAAAPPPDAGGEPTLLGEDGADGWFDSDDALGAAPPPAAAAPPPSAGAAPSPPRAAAPPPAAITPTGDATHGDPTAGIVGRRLLADVAGPDGTFLERAFLAGTRHEVSIAIGRPTRGSTVYPSEDLPEPAFPDGVQRVELIVRLAYRDGVQEGRVYLPRDTGRNSTAVPFDLDVPSDARNVSALVAVYHEARLLQGAVLRGPVVADAAAERTHGGAIELDVQAWVQALGPVLPGSRTEGSIVVGGGQAIASTGTKAVPLSVDVAALRQEAGDLWDRIEAAAELLYHGQPDELDRAFRDLALHGRRLRARFVAQLPDELVAATHLQVVAADPSAVLPLELVYDGPQPTPDAAVCTGWRGSISGGTCATCGPSAAAGAGAVCPLRFWGLSRVIEHHAGLGGSSGRFELRAERYTADASLPPLTGAVVAASSRVEERAVEAVVAAAAHAFGSATRVRTWDEWQRIVAAEAPQVLVALPHHELDDRVDPPLSSLEVGGSLLAAGAIDPRHVRPPGARAPVVLLLGCNTGSDDSPLDTFAGEFRMNGASFVVSTMAKVLTDHAPAIAGALLEALVRSHAPEASRIGDAVLAARRTLVARDLIVALAVVGHGDAEWLLGADR